MRFLVIILVVLLAIWYFLPEQEPPPVEESFIGPQVKALRKAEKFEDSYLESVKESQEKMEQQLKEDGG